MPSPVSALIATEPSWSATSCFGRVGREVGLVEHEQLGHLLRVDLVEHGPARRRSGLGIGGARVDHVDEQVGLGHHFERALERLDQPVGQAAHEARPCR